MSKREITILIVNFNSSEFIEVSLYALTHLTKNSFEVFIVDNGSKLKDYGDLKKIVTKYNNVHLERFETKLRGSEAHGTALNYLIKKVDTSYFTILDADATFLIKEWDEILINRMTDKVSVIGTQAPKPKPQDFPLMFAILFRTAEFKNLNIDFRPKDILRSLDTGWELRDLYLKNGYTGKNLKEFNTRNYKKGPFAKIICAEYYLDERKAIFASHFGRGSSLGVKKYKKGIKNLFGKIPVIRSIIAERIGRKEKKEWIGICKEVIDEQIMKEIKLKRVSCDFCGERKNKKLFDSRVFYNNLPGVFSVIKCQKCGLVFTSPRPVRESMGFFYPAENTGYLKCYKPKKNRGISNKIYKIILREYFGYFPEQNSNILLKLLLWPVFVLKYNFLKTKGLPIFIKNGKLLDIGCASGAFLLEMRELGWDVKGIEPIGKVARYAKKKFNLDIECCDIDLYRTEEKFDVITMRMVLEHVYSPMHVLKKIKLMLKKNGILIITVPDFSGLEAQLYKEYAYTLQVPNHLFHFTPETICKYLKMLNFDKIGIYHHNVDRDFVASLNYIKDKNAIVSIIKKMLSCRLIRSLLVEPFVSVLAYLGKTSRMTIYVKVKN